MNQLVMVVPTYNEAANIESCVRSLLAAMPTAEVLIVDDASPDGTGRIADTLAAADRRIHVLHRPGKAGLGVAYRAGFAWALERGYPLIGQMDSDGQHPAEVVPRLAARITAGGGDLVLASRYVEGGGTDGWPLHRRALSGAAGGLARAALGLPYRDLSGGFKLWRAEALREIEVGSTISPGFAFQVETTQRAHECGLRIVEEPYIFCERRLGESKLTAAIPLEGARTLYRLRRAARTRRSAA